jgi:formamidopyrimidine-DNA glycosylase
MSAELDFAQQSLEQWFAGRTLARVEAEAGARIFRGCDLGLFNALSGRLSNVSRRGPVLVLKFSSALALSVQLGDAAKFLKRSATDEVKWSRARFTLDDGTVVHLQDNQQLSRVDIARSKDKGALDVSRRAPSVGQLQAALDRSNQEFKVALRDEARVVGLESARVDEVLFVAKVHPERVAATLSPAEWQAVVRALEAKPSLTLVAGAPCPKCGAPLEARKQSGDDTCFCPECQPKRRRVEGDQMRVKPRPRKYRG